MNRMRIMQSTRTWRHDTKPYIHFPYFEVLSADFKETLSEHKTFLEASTALERIIRQEKVACPTGGCDD